MTRALPLKIEVIIFCYNFLILATLSQILIFSNLILHNFILVSKSNSSVSKLFIFIRIRCVLNLHPNLRQYQIHNVVQNSESQPKDLYFSKGIFSGLIFCAAYIRTFQFSNLNIEKELDQGEVLLFLQVVLIEQVKRYKFISFIKR